MSDLSSVLRPRRIRPSAARRPLTPPPFEEAPTAHDPQLAIRPTVVQQCAALGVRLTDKRRAVLSVLDEVSMPIVIEHVWRKSREQGLDVNRSMIFRLVADLVRLGVLEPLGHEDRRDRYATPLSVPIEVRAPGLEAPRPVRSPALGELLVAVLADLGQPLAGRRIVISVVD